MLNTRGTLALRQGDHRRAEDWLDEGLTLSRELGDQRGIVDALEGIARLATGQGSAAVGAGLLGAVEVARAAADLPRVPGESAHYAQLVAALHVALAAQAFAAAWDEGRALSLDEAIALALEGHAETPVGQ
jgi:hypothetical protein